MKSTFYKNHQQEIVKELAKFKKRIKKKGIKLPSVKLDMNKKDEAKEWSAIRKKYKKKTVDAEKEIKLNLERMKRKLWI